jgi:hypothetical protein
MSQEKSVFTIDGLIARVNECFDKKEAERIYHKVLVWNFDVKENILMQLCELGYERVATNFMNHYPEHSDFNFFLYCIENERIHFIKNALSQQFFDLDYMH